MTYPLRETIIDAPPRGMQIIGWNGQSNATGTVPRPEQNLLGGARTFMLTLGGKWVSPAFDPSQTTEAAFGGSLYPSVFKSDQRRGSGAAIYCLNKWTELNPQTNVALVNIASAGSEIKQHLPQKPVYAAGHALLTRAKQYGDIVGLVWIQGETDARSKETASQWAENFMTLSSAWRANYGETIPIIIAQLGDPVWPERWPYWNLVQEQQKHAVDLVPNTALVRTVGLKKELVDGSEGPHYTDDSFHSLGETIALALYALSKNAR